MNEKKEYGPDPGKEMAERKPEGELTVVRHGEIVNLIEQALQARKQAHEEMVVLPKDLQIAVLEIRDALKLQAQSTAELARAIQTIASRGGGGAGRF